MAEDDLDAQGHPVSQTWCASHHANPMPVRDELLNQRGPHLTGTKNDMKLH